MGTAERISELVHELETDVRNIHVVANKVTEDNKEQIQKTANELGLKLIGLVPTDESIAERDLAGEALYDLPEDSKAVIEVERIAVKLGL
jgi:CO dehydrogenase maturation factor